MPRLFKHEMTDTERLIMNLVRTALKELQKTGVGRIEDKVDNRIFYKIDDTVIEVSVNTER